MSHYRPLNFRLKERIYELKYDVKRIISKLNSLIENIDIYAFAKDNNANVQINKPENLIIGDNEIIISVKAEGLAFHELGKLG